MSLIIAALDLVGLAEHLECEAGDALFYSQFPGEDEDALTQHAIELQREADQLRLAAAALVLG